MNSGTFNINIFIFQVILIVSLFGIILWIIRLNKAHILEKRYKKYTIETINDNSLSLFDKIKNYYYEKRNNLSKALYKSKLLDDYSKKYEKYCDKTKRIREDKMNFISDKIFIGLSFIVIVIISDIFQYKSIEFMQIITAFLIGFFVLDVVLLFKEKARKKQIEQDMLKAIIIMNNAFKSGLSIMQSIYMVSKELDGPISEEFKKMYIDISFGLNMDVVFERFAKRVDTMEAKYITTSLSVLNKTGGNIVQVFSSVERSSFTRKKLNEELGATTASAKMIYRTLLCVPIIVFLMIFMMNTKFFTPLFTTEIGIMILILIISIYILYIIVIRKIMKVGVNV